MKSLVKRFTLVVIVSIYFISVYPMGNLYAQEVIELPQGYETEFYNYQFKKPDDYLNVKWEIIKIKEEVKPPKWMKLSSTGLLYGTPVLVEEAGKKKTKKKIYWFKVKATGKIVCNIGAVPNEPVRIKNVSKEYIVALKINKYRLRTMDSQEVLELPQGYVSEYYTYQFEKPQCYWKTKWEMIEGKEELPEGMRWSSSGLLYGIPERETEKYLYLKVKLTGYKLNTEDEVDPKEYIAKLKINKYPLRNKGEASCAIVGVEHSGASSAHTEEKFFIGLYFCFPFPMEGKTFNKPHFELGRPLTIWGNIRLTSLPKQISDPFITPGAFTDVISNLKIYELAQGVEFLFGLDGRFWKLPLRSGNRLYSLNIIGAYGFIIPTFSEDSLQIFKLPPKISPEYKETIDNLSYRYGIDPEYLKSKEYVAFVNPDRKKFFRQCFLGFRIKGYPKPEPIERLKNGDKIIEGFKIDYPTVVEVSIGLNNFIAPNKKIPLVLRIGGFFPFKISREICIYVFGTAMLNFKKKFGQDKPITLASASPDTPYPDPTVAQITNIGESRDYYRLGIGIEFSKFFKKIFNLL